MQVFELHRNAVMFIFTWQVQYEMHLQKIKSFFFFCFYISPSVNKTVNLNSEKEICNLELYII